MPPRFGLRREDVEEYLGLPALRAQQEQHGWKLTSARNPHDLAQAEGALTGVNQQIATLEAIAEIIELNNQQILEDLQRLLGVARRPTGPPPPQAVSAEPPVAAEESGAQADESESPEVGA